MKEGQVQEALGGAIKSFTRYSNIYDATVINTDNAETDFIVDVQLLSDGNPVYYGVPLMVLTGSQASFIGVPVLNTPCLISFRDGNNGRPQILFIDQLLKILVKTNNFVINSDTTVFNDGELGGMVKVIELTTKLNNLEKLVNDLVSKFNTHTHILTLTSGTGTAAPTVSPETTVLTPTVRGDIEDENITH